MPKAENEQLAEKRSFEGNWEILSTVSQPRALSSDIPAGDNHRPILWSVLSNESP